MLHEHKNSTEGALFAMQQGDSIGISIPGLGRKKKEEPQPVPDGTRTYFVADLDKTTTKNKAFRRILFTNDNFQLGLQTLKAGERLPPETHKSGTQFFRVEKGKLAVITSDRGGQPQIVEKDGAVIVPAGVEHELVNVSSGETSFYTIYTPPQHEKGQVDQRMADAVAREEKESLRRQVQPRPVQPKPQPQPQPRTVQPKPQTAPVRRR